MLAFCSLWGAPGVTSVSYRVASAISTDLARTVLLAECDPCGGDLAVRLSMSATPGLASLAAQARRGLEVDDLWGHVQESPSGVGLLLGLTCAEQSTALDPFWGGLARVLAKVNGVEVVIDAGRLLPGVGAMQELLGAASTIVVCARPDAASLVHAARRIPTVFSANPVVQMVLVGDGPYGAKEAEEATGVEVIGVLDAEGIGDGGSGSETEARASLASRAQRARSLFARQGGRGNVIKLAERLMGGSRVDRAEGCTPFDDDPAITRHVDLLQHIVQSSDDHSLTDVPGVRAVSVRDLRERDEAAAVGRAGGQSGLHRARSIRAEEDYR